MNFSNKLGIHILLFLIATFIACTDNDIQENNNNLPPKDEPTPPQEEAEEHLFDILNLDYPGLEEIKSLYKSGENDAAMQKLLTYYRSRTDIENPNLTATLNDTEQGYADYAIDEYRFYVNDNYLEDKDRKIPYSLKSNDQTINWQFAPEGADNEYQKQLHRHNWIPMQGKAYQKSKNEKYMLSWKEVYTDWILKNPKPNGKPDKFQWHQLQMSTRIMGQTESFEYFKSSSHFTPEWLSFFLIHFAEHADYLSMYKYSGENNILLSQAVALVFAGTLFPELKNAPQWQKIGCEIINDQTTKLFLEDGMTNDLSLHYHIGIVDGLYDLKRLIQLNKLPDNQLSPQLDETLLKATKVVMHFTYPSYFEKGSKQCSPAFNDSWIKTRSVLNKNFVKYAAMFPEDSELKYMQTYGNEGTLPDSRIKTFEDSGFYVLRNGWTPESTMLILSNNISSKLQDSSHNQLDNGTFELYHNGRNFFPDSGVCSYMKEDDAEVMKLRRWFRQTKAHNTMVLGKSEDHEDIGAENISKAEGKLLLKEENADRQLIVTENQGYNDFKHRRAVFYVKQPTEFFVLVDEGFGTATGYAKLYFHLCDETSVNNVILDSQEAGAHTTFENNNLLIRSFGNQAITLKPFDGRISYQTDRKYSTRKAYSLVMKKQRSIPVRYITILYPVSKVSNQKISAKFTDDPSNSNHVSIEVTIGNQVYPLSFQLKH